MLNEKYALQKRKFERIRKTLLCMVCRALRQPCFQIWLAQSSKHLAGKLQ